MTDLIERLRLGEGTSPDHLLLLEAEDALEKSVECLCGICKLGPPQREWVGLTDEEIDHFCHLAYTGDEELVLTIQAKLKEKNNG